LAAGQLEVSVTVPSNRPQGFPPTRLPFTGLDLGRSLLLGALLIVLGFTFLRIRRNERGTRMSRRLLTVLAIVAALSVGMATVGSAAEYQVTVSSPPGSRTIYVEDLLGQPLTALDFGNARSMPFRVRVVDADMSRSDFDVESSLSNLYLEDGGSYSWSDKISSSDLSLGFGSSPLNLADPTALVAPIFDLVIPGATCTLLQTLGASGCSLTNITGVLQTVELPLDLGDLTNLPLLPQVGDAGAYTQPNFAGVAAGDPTASGAPAETLRTVLSGTSVSSLPLVGPVLSDLQSTLLGVISPGGANVPATGVIDTGVLTGALQSLLGPAFDLLGSLGLPSLNTLLGQLTWTLDNLSAGDILRQSGTYTAYPVLNVNVPSTATGGTYKGTMVLTFIQP
jgi:hypothetical protein